MKANRTAVAVAAGLLTLCCSAQADSRNDRSPSVRPEQRSSAPPATRRPAASPPPRRGSAEQSRKRADTDRRGSKEQPAASNLRAEDRPGPAMPIPIPGVG